MQTPAGGHGGNAAGASAPGGPIPGAAGGIAGAAQQFPEGSAEAALLKFCAAMADSNLTEAGEYISPKAKGMLAQIRDGSITDEKIDTLKESFELTGLTLKPSRQTGAGKSITLGNGKSELLSFTLMKEDDAYLLREFKISKQPANAARLQGR